MDLTTAQQLSPRLCSLPRHREKMAVLEPGSDFLSLKQEGAGWILSVLVNILDSEIYQEMKVIGLPMQSRINESW